MTLALLLLLDRSAAASQVYDSTAELKLLEEHNVVDRISRGDLGSSPGMRPWAYGLVLKLFVTDSTGPPGFDAEASIRAIRSSAAHPDDLPLDATDLAVFSWGLDPANRARWGDLALELAAEDPSYRPAIRILTSASHRGLGQLSLARAQQNLAAEEIATLSKQGQAPSQINLARSLLGIERCRLAVDTGVPELGATFVDEARHWAEVYRQQTEDPELWFRAIEAELDLAAAIDDLRRSQRVLAEARAHPAWQELPMLLRGPLELRGAVAIAQPRELNSELREQAVQQLGDLLKSGALDDTDRHVASFWRVLTLIDLGRLKEARKELDATLNKEGPPHRFQQTAALSALELRLRRLTHAEVKADTIQLAQDTFDALLKRGQASAGLSTGRALSYYCSDTLTIEECLSLRLRLDGPEAALEDLCKLHSVGSLALALQASATADRVREQLVPENGGLIILVPCSRQDYLALVDSDQTSFHPAGKSLRVVELQQELQRLLLSDPKRRLEDPRLTASVRKLSSELLNEEVLEQLRNWQSITVVGTDAYGYVPFELLLDQDTRLGDRHPIAYLPSLAVGIHIATSVNRPLERVVVAVATNPEGNTHALTEAQALPFEARHRQVLEDGLVNRETTWLEDSELSLARLVSELRISDGAHLLTHGSPVQRGSTTWGLVLPEGQGLLLPEQLRSGPNPQTVFVQACASWRGPHRRGDDGRGHLVGALLEGGSSLIIAASVPISYTDSLDASSTFWSQLGQGKSAAQSMRAARNGKTLAPYLLHIIGNGHRAEHSAGIRPERSWWNKLWLALLLLGLACLLVRRAQLKAA